MVSSTTVLNKEDLEIVEPRERQLYTREGFDRKQVRYEFANTSALGLNDRYVNEEDVMYVNPDTSDLPQGPTGIGEVGGSGVDFVVQEGEVHPTYRFTQGFEVQIEDVRAGAVDVAQQRNKVVEMFDFLSDSMFLAGIEDRNGNQLRPGIFQWLKQNIPAERTFDCAQYANGTEADYDATNTQENLIKYDAFRNLSGRAMDPSNPRWDMMLGRQPALAHFNKRAPSDGGTDPRDTYWDRINASKGVGVGVNGWNLIQDQMRFSEAPEGQEPLTVDLTQQLGDDEVILLPSMDFVRRHYWRLREMPTPDVWGPMAERGGRERYDYIWRYSHSFDPIGEHPKATDAIHLTNVSSLFI